MTSKDTIKEIEKMIKQKESEKKKELKYNQKLNKRIFSEPWKKLPEADYIYPCSMGNITEITIRVGYKSKLFGIKQKAVIIFVTKNNGGGWYESERKILEELNIQEKEKIIEIIPQIWEHIKNKYGGNPL